MPAAGAHARGMLLVVAAVAGAAFAGAQAVVPSSAGALKETLRSRLQPAIDALAMKYNTSLSIGYRDDHIRLELVAGVEDRATGALARTSSIYPAGSVTKVWTAAAILQLVEQGKIRLDDLMHTYVDPWLQREHNTTLRQLWGNALIEKVTIEQLLTMRSGLQDYDDTLVRDWTMAHPNEDYTPFMYLDLVNKSFVCEPSAPGCVAYTGIGFVLLGLILTNQLTASNVWTAYDQKSVIPEVFRGEFVRTQFPLLGPCSKYEGMVHQYVELYGPSNINDNTQVLYLTDIIDDSCLNGWTMGNIALPALDAASFFYHLLVAEDIVGPASVERMKMIKKLTVGWGAGRGNYGMGLEGNTFPTTSGEDFLTFGHGGVDWGSEACITLGSKELGFGFAVLMSSNIGMNCSLPDVRGNSMARHESRCALVAEVLDVLREHGGDAPTVNCTAYYDSLGDDDGELTCYNRTGPLSIVSGNQFHQLWLVMLVLAAAAVITPVLWVCTKSALRKRAESEEDSDATDSDDG